MKIEKYTLLAMPLAVILLSQTAHSESQLLDEITVRGQQEAPNETSLSIREVRESSAKDVGEALKQVEGA